MAQGIFKKDFASEFAGIDGKNSALELEGNHVNRAVNYEMSVGDSLRGRVGCQTSGSYGFFAIFPHRYTRTQDQYDIVYQTAAGAYPTQTTSLTTTTTAADGASIERLIGLAYSAWVLDTFNFTITQTNAGAYTWYSYVNGSNINFCIKKDGATILDTSLGDGVTSNVTIWSLLNTIDGLADLAISRTTRGTCPPFAIVNGAQSIGVAGSVSYGSTRQITVNNTPHNFSAGDILTWIDSVEGVLKSGFVLSTTATVITFVGPTGDVANGQILGYMGQYASNFPISTVSSESAGVFTLSMPYWRALCEGDKGIGESYGNPYFVWQNKATTGGGYSTASFYAPPVAENASGNLYIAATGTSGVTDTWVNNLVAQDGVQPRRVGLPTLSMGANAGLVPAGSLTGSYRYIAFFRRYDAQGNVWDGPWDDFGPITYTSEAGQLVPAWTTTYSAQSGFNSRSCFKHTTESPASGSSFYVDDSTGGVGNNAFMQPGDVCILTDNTAQTTGLWTDSGLSVVAGAIHRTRVTAYTPLTAVISPTISSIKVADSSGYQINTNTPISAGLTLVIGRTTAGGTTYYQLCEYPVTGFAGSITLYDDVTDLTLSSRTQLTRPEIGKEHDAPPNCTLVCQHQGGLVVARGLTTPNTVTVSTADGLEYFPTASNSFDVPSTQSGLITAIASDTADRLAVFKERAYYDVVGDVDAGTFSIDIKAEGDYGITSQASLVRANGELWGLSKNGWIVIKDGFLDAYRFDEVNARIVNQNYQFGWATAVNDSFNRQYICTIPQVSGEPVGYVLDYSRLRGTEEQRFKTLERSYATKLDQAGGGAMIGDTLYHLSATAPYGVFRRLRRFNSDSPSGNGDGDSFIDNTSAITYILESAPINNGEPSLYKSPIRIRIWSIPNDYVVEGWVPFSALVETGASPIAAYVGNANPGGTASTISFAASTDVFKDVKLVKTRACFYILRLTTNTIRTAPFITGFEMKFAENYAKEDFVK